ncbi:MAG: type II toxin-antitoxin system RelE/ParE family toxin [Candidatus Tokpelaia sp.]|nr:MAG: type II toxin-antitoxin system RelE/ParE family toxin [Candidatus Tokpelaia sp.]KAA6206168.1 MAG: type II toxin-antitoxin system RelE/ParE family toxin [Candidatus Tokpelaia sp.]
MTYELEFKQKALKEWQKLPFNIREYFKKALAKRLQNPHIPAARLSGADFVNCYKIKLRNAGYRLVYEVDRLVVLVMAVGRRDKSAVYKIAHKRV